MNEGDVKTYENFVLPSNVVSKIDVSRLVSEAERVDNELTEIEVRTKAGTEVGPQPAFSGQFQSFLDQNGLKFDDSNKRTELVKELHKMKDSLPVLHMTFASPADGESLQKLADWVRTSVHPQAVIEVGLQPALVGGVYLRTPNHVHDWSLRAKLKNGHELLVKELEAVRGAK